MRVLIVLGVIALVLLFAREVRAQGQLRNYAPLMLSDNRVPVPTINTPPTRTTAP